MKFVTSLVVALLATVTPSSSTMPDNIHLKHMSTIYVPYSYLSAPRIDIDSDSVEQVAFDAPNGYAYVIGDDYLQIIDYNDYTAEPEIVYKHTVPHRANDVAHCGGLVAYLLQGGDSQEPGSIYIYKKYDRQSQRFEKVFEHNVNSQPEMLTFTPDCSKILTADEGTAGDNAMETEFLNPEGMVSIISVMGDHANPSFEVTSVSFEHFNNRRSKYAGLGVRFPYNDHYGNYTEQTLSQSVEPEYIAVNPRDNVAYINLQENNAIAILDLNEMLITEIVPLGVKEWQNLELDPSDRDDAVAFQTGYDIKSFYMPDAITYFEIDGVGFIATADEGSDLDYHFDGSYWGDARRGESIHDDNQLASTVSDELREALNDDLRLGRLEFSVRDGLSTTEEGKIEELFFFGGRGFSILKASDLSRVYDSGDDIEKMVAKYYPLVFNSETYPDRAATESPSDLVDKRSDNRGPECETIVSGVVNGKTLLFVGVDRASVIMIYEVFANGTAKFVTAHRRGGLGKTFAELLEDRDLGDLDPKDMEFVSAEDNPKGTPMLMVAGAASGTVSLYQVIDPADSDSSALSGDTNSDKGGASLLSGPGLLIITLMSSLALFLPK